jgi:hypothetical protein
MTHRLCGVWTWGPPREERSRPTWRVALSTRYGRRKGGREPCTSPVALSSFSPPTVVSQQRDPAYNSEFRAQGVAVASQCRIRPAARKAKGRRKKEEEEVT